MKPLTVLGHVVRVPLLGAGLMFTAAMVWAHVLLLPTFTSAKYRDFWDDAAAYHLRADDHKPLDQLYSEYGTAYVHDYVVRKFTTPAFLPSDTAARAHWVGYMMEHSTGDPPQRSADRLREAPLEFLVLIVPVMMFVGLLTRNLSWALCRSERAMELFAEHYDVPLWRRLLGGVLTAPVVVGLAALGAYLDWTPDLRRAGFTLTDLTVIAVIQSYLGGAVVRFVRGVIDAGFLAAGVNPERTVRDDLAAVVVTAPVLIFLYGNSPVGILADLAAGVGPRLVGKLWQWLRPARADAVLEVVEVARGAEAVRRNWWVAGMAGVIGLVFFVCVGGSGLISPGEAAPTTMTIADLEAGKLPPRVTWVKVDDGYLYWPLLTAVPREGYPDEVERYVVPLVSAQTRDEWLAELRKGATASYKSAHTRPVVAFVPADLERLFPGAAPGRFDPGRPWVEFVVTGQASKLSEKSARYRTAVGRGDAAEAAVLVIENDDRPIGQREYMVAVALLGLATLLPLPLRWLLAGRGPRR